MSIRSELVSVLALALVPGLILGCNSGAEGEGAGKPASTQLDVAQSAAVAQGQGPSEAERGWVLSKRQAAAARLAPVYPAQIRLHNRTEVITQEMKTATVGKPGIRLIHVNGPVADGFVEGLVAAGLLVLDYVPDGGYTVYDPGQWLPNATLASKVDYTRDWVASDRLERSLDLMAAEQDVAVLVVDHASNADTQFLIANRAVAHYAGVSRVKNTLVHRVRLPVDTIHELETRADVYWIEPYLLPQLMDERQGVITAGNIDSSGVPTGPGYQSWLTARGLTAANLARIKVEVTDSGADSGTLPVTHVDLAAGIKSIANYTSDSGGYDVGGHGTINLAIIGGAPPDPNAAGSKDADSYLYGLGIAPGVHLGASRVFNTAGDWSVGTATLTQIVSAARSGGALVTSNSWGTAANGAYTVDSQEYDSIVRDVDGNPSNGLQPIAVFFSAGNAGSGATTVGSPGTAKNVITVGASENYRMTGRDGCRIANTGADNARDIIYFSGRGPTTDGRRKPDIVAPGTHIQGASTTYARATGSGVCDRYWPAGQTRYAWSSGTSHSCPAAAGMGALVHSWYLDSFGVAPSPAMVKAILAAHSADMVGGANGAGGVLGNIPDQSQGWGRLDMSRLFTTADRTVSDQTGILGSNGDSFTSPPLAIRDQTQRVKVVLAWTDAPGAVTGHAYANDLDLLVTVGANQYRGNVFSGGVSATGGSFDRVNNLEAVHFDPAGATRFSVQVIANNLVADGVPGNADLTDQDFALYIFNATDRPSCSTAADCNDSNPCTNEVCAVDGRCSYSQKCNDNNLCTVDSCNPSTGACSNLPADCSDGNECTTDTCNPSTGCINVNASQCTSCDGGAKHCVAGHCGGPDIAGSNNFESGTLGFGYTTSNPPWTVVNTGAHAGSYAAASGLGAGDVADNQYADLTAMVYLTTAGNVSFWHRESTQADHDGLIFFADGNVLGSWSGTANVWAKDSYSLTAGTHSLDWVYYKDGGGSAGSDAVWVDDIVVSNALVCETGNACEDDIFNGSGCTTCALPNGTTCSGGACQGGVCSSGGAGGGGGGGGQGGSGGSGGAGGVSTGGAGTGGVATGGVPTGGVSTGGTGTGGVSTGGVSTGGVATGGAGTGGVATGGVGTGGAATGGAGTGGVATGGVGTGGSATGGAGTGGVATGGVSTGGAGTGGVATGGFTFNTGFLGGIFGTGGGFVIGGVPEETGGAATGGAATGGAATGGVATGGVSTGGAGTGGVATGGLATGGAPQTGGTPAVGGTPATGGTSATGAEGGVPTGGVGGEIVTGATGGATATGGAGGAQTVGDAGEQDGGGAGAQDGAADGEPETDGARREAGVTTARTDARADAPMPSGGTTATSSKSPARSSGGCGCRTGGGSDNTGAASLLMVLALLGVRRRRAWLKDARQPTATRERRAGRRRIGRAAKVVGSVCSRPWRSA